MYAACHACRRFYVIDGDPCACSCPGCGSELQPTDRPAIAAYIQRLHEEPGTQERIAVSAAGGPIRLGP